MPQSFGLESHLKQSGLLILATALSALFTTQKN